MKQFLTFALAFFPLLCLGAPSISYTSYFNNTHTYTNSTTAGTNSASRGVFTNGITAGASTFTGTVEHRNGTTAMSNLVYGTYTDASNYRLGAMAVSTGGILDISSRGLGTGATGNTIRFLTDGTARWTVNSSGHFLAGADNTYDIGASGATRPRNVFVAGAGNFGGAVTAAGELISSGAGVRAASSSWIYWASRSAIESPSDGVLTVHNAAGTDFGRVQFGGTSAGFPALKRSTTNLVVRLADDSANTCLEANVLISRLNATSAAAPTIASATTIAPTNSIVFISGTTAIETITAPAPISATGGQITLIPTGIFTTTTAGNIALASTAVVSKALIMTYDSGTTKWYPSY